MRFSYKISAWASIAQPVIEISTYLLFLVTFFVANYYSINLGTLFTESIWFISIICLITILAIFSIILICLGYAELARYYKSQFLMATAYSYAALFSLSLFISILPYFFKNLVMLQSDLIFTVLNLLSQIALFLLAAALLNLKKNIKLKRTICVLLVIIGTCNIIIYAVPNVLSTYTIIYFPIQFIIWGSYITQSVFFFKLAKVQK